MESERLAMVSLMRSRSESVSTWPACRWRGWRQEPEGGCSPGGWRQTPNPPLLHGLHSPSFWALRLGALAGNSAEES